MFSSGAHGNYSRSALWQDVLYAAHADVVINGHDHDYERFGGRPRAARERRPASASSSSGPAAPSWPFGSIKAHSLVRNATTVGVLKLTLHASSYDWKFVPQAGKSFTDSRTGAPCRA